MKKYYTEKGEISKAEAAKIKKQNQEIMKIRDRREWLEAMQNAQFILTYDTQKPENGAGFKTKGAKAKWKNTQKSTTINYTKK